MNTFVLVYFFVRIWLRAVKIYLHAKFRASSSKIERVMLNLVFGTPPPCHHATCDQPTCRAVRFAPANNNTMDTQYKRKSRFFLIKTLGLGIYHEFFFFCLDFRKTVKSNR